MQAEKVVNKVVKFTYEDYLHFSEDKRYEIIDGEVAMVPSPGETHQDICANLAFVLRGFVKENDLGKVYFAPFDVILSEIDVVQPDIIFITKQRLDIISEKGVHGAPDLVVEILSEFSEYRDKVIKRKLYSKHEIKEYWIVNPEKKEIEVMSLKKGIFETARIYHSDDILTSPFFEGLEVALGGVFCD
ncbi:MAG: Uma2 family endonuclease [Thermodesulfobacteriota bacterium]|nr:Uma2 family endonuclease [Thermodesulfobacteriota bacterium]